MTSYRTARTEPTEKLLPEKLNATMPTLKLIYMLPIMPYTTSRQFVDGHFKSVMNNRRRLYKTATPLAKDRKNTLANSRPI